MPAGIVAAVINIGTRWMPSVMASTKGMRVASPKPRKRWLKINPFVYPTVKPTYLKRPQSLPAAKFTNVLLNRRSRRQFRPLSEGTLSTLLWLAAKTRETTVYRSEIIHQHRSAPASGGVHAIDIIVIRRLPVRWAVFLYDPGAHALVRLAIRRSCLAAMLREVRAIVPIGNATVLWMVGDLGRLRARYLNERSLIWRDAGTLLATLCLVSEALRLAACPHGGLAEPWLSRMLGGQGKLSSLGGLLVGERD